MKNKFLTLAIFLIASLCTLTLLNKTWAANEPTDDDVIEQLRLAGSNLSQPHPIDFYLYVPSKEAARRIATQLSGQQFQVKVEYSIIGFNWLVLASKSVVPTSATLAKFRRDMTALARNEHGAYDGWEAAVVK